MKKIFAKNILLLIMAIFIDQLTKLLADSFFPVVKNQGLLLNALEDMPNKVKILTLGTSTGVLFFFYLTFIYLINQRLERPRYALTLLMSGIISNTLDKIIFGYTKDFLPIGPYAFNMADIMTIGGTAFLMISLLKHHRELWITEDNRRSILVNPKAQVMFGLKYSIVAISTSFLLGIMALAYIKNYIFPTVLTSSQNLLPTFIVLHLTVTFVFSAIVFVVGIIVSHRFVGPIVALERFVENLNQGKDSNLNLRQGDYFKQLEELSRKINEIKKD
jgi:lipoprotein signal peptidase